MIIETERLIIRELNKNDLDNFHRVIGDKDTMKYYDAPYSREVAEIWLSKCLEGYKKDGHSLWALIRKSDKSYIGDCGITTQNIDGEELPEVGYHIYKDFWGNGYGSEAAKGVVDYGFNQLMIPRLYSYMTKENTPSQNVAKKVGMTFVKEYKMNESKDVVVYSISR